MQFGMPCPGPATEVKVPAKHWLEGVAEAYFVERLRIHYRTGV